MATNQVLVKIKGVYTFKSSSYSPTAINDIDPAGSTTVDLTMGLTSGIAIGGAMNSDQVDLGALRGAQFSVQAALEWFVAIAAGGSVNMYWSYSNNSVVTDGNMGNPDGADGDYTGDGGGTVAESVRQMQWIGAFKTTDLQGVQKSHVGIFSPKDRYGQIIIVNNTSAIVCGTDDIESAIVMSEIIEDIQAAA